MKQKTYQRLSSLVTENGYGRKTYSEYQKMKKKEILKTLKSMFANYDKLRKRYVDLCLENEYLKRELEKRRRLKQL